MIDRVLANNLRQERKKRNLTQVELANMTGIERKTIIYYETCKHAANLNTIETIAAALKVSVIDLLTERS